MCFNACYVNCSKEDSDTSPARKFESRNPIYDSNQLSIDDKTNARYNQASSEHEEKESSI